MNKAEALQALKEGKTVKHRLFQDHEWIRMIDNKIQTEEGYLFPENLFWMDRNTGIWNEGWEILEDQIVFKP